MRKDKKRKNPVVRRDMIAQTKHEIGVLMDRLNNGQVPPGKIEATERRVSCLMNQTLPKLGAQYL